MPRKKPKKYRRLQEWEREAILQAYKDGEKLLALAAEFDTLESTISRIAERAGLPRRKKANAPRYPSLKKIGVNGMTKREYYLERQRLVALRIAQRPQ